MKYKVVWNTGAKEKIMKVPELAMYFIARKTLDKTYPHIPLSAEVNRGRLRASSLAYGVQKQGNKYTIGSATYYASKVWNYGEGTHWTTPGTFGKWYDRIWKENGNAIANMAITKYKLK